MRVLLVDDEESLSSLMCMILARHGFVTHACKDAAAARAAFAGTGERWDLAIVDLSLPDEEGGALARWMAEQRPDAKFLICSGWPFDLGELPAELRSRFGAIQKPFVPADLLCSVRTLLGC